MAFGKLLLAQIVVFFVTIGMLAWLFSAFGGVASQVECIVSNVNDMLALKGKTGLYINKAIGDGALRNYVTQVDQFTALLRIVIIIPAVVILVVQAMLLLCATTAKMCCKSAKCSKYLIIILTIFCALGIGFYSALGGFSLASFDGDAIIKSAGCDTNSAQFQEYLDDYTKVITSREEELKSVPGSASVQAKIDEAKFEAGEAEKALAYIKALCLCLVNLIASWPSMGTPALITAACFLMIMLLNWCTCYQLGCLCGVPQTEEKKKVRV